MVFCITCGKFKHQYKYILYSAISLLISDFAFGINYYNFFKDVSLIDLFGYENDNFNQHFYIRQIFCYFGTFILSIILYQFETKISGGEPINYENNSFNHVYLYILKFLFLMLFWVIEEKLSDKLNNILKHLDFWMYEFIFLSFFCKKYLQIEIYNHQILAMILTLIPCALKIVTIILSFYDENRIQGNFNDFRRKDGLLEILYVPYPWLIPIGIIIYVSLKIMRAYIKTKIKWYMDIKYISITKILMNYGLFGTIFYTIICIITTFKECPKGYKNIYDYICETVDFSKNHKYFASFRLYFTTILFKSPLTEIITLFFGILGFSFYKYFSLMIIKNLSPILLVFSFPLFYIMRKIILTISFLFNDNIKTSETFIMKYIIDSIADFFCLFIYLIYLEIIKLNFCNLNFNLRDNIITRSRFELYSKDLINEIESDNTNDNNSGIDREETKNSFNTV